MVIYYNNIHVYANAHVISTITRNYKKLKTSVNNIRFILI